MFSLRIMQASSNFGSASTVEWSRNQFFEYPSDWRTDNLTVRWLQQIFCTASEKGDFQSPITRIFKKLIAAHSTVLAEPKFELACMMRSENIPSTWE